MKLDGKTANPRSDRIDCERFGEASRRSFRLLEGGEDFEKIDKR